MGNVFDNLGSEPPVPEDEALTRSILESTPHCIAVISNDLRLLYGNQNFFRFSKKVLGGDLRIGESFVDFMPENYRRALQLRLTEIFQGQCIRLEETLEIDGDTRFFDVAYQPLADGNSWNKVVIYFEEITHRKRNEIKSSLLEQELRDSLATRETLLSVVSHDLRSPVFQLNGLLFLIRQAVESRDEARIKMQAEDLEERISHLTHTLDNLLSWSNQQQQDLKPIISEFAISPVIQHAVGLNKPVALRKGLEIKSETGLDQFLVSDREMTAFVVRNLISNAIKFSRQNGVVEITTETSDQRLQFTITDHGVGIQKDKVEILKEGSMYFSETGTWGERGTGVGIRTCRDFIRRLGGTIEFDSTLGTGTTVRVELPQLVLP